MKRIALAFLIMGILKGYSQTEIVSAPLSVSGYIETYWTYDWGRPINHNRPGFIYSHNRHNEVNLNLGFIKAAYSTDKVRANFAMMTGTYANANLADEPGVFRNTFESNAGIKLSGNRNLWVDAGVFASHIGFESAIGKDCWNLTRSILADNSPYYESGVKLSYTTNNEKWHFSGLVLNGWQQIQRIPGNSFPSMGHQITYKHSSKLTINSSSFIGSDSPDSLRLMRYFHNFYSQLQVSDKLGIMAGFDIGAQQKVKGGTAYNTWYSPVLILRYSSGKKWNLAARGEYYSDVNGVIISTGTVNGFQTLGYSLNLDYAIMPNILWRIEGRSFVSKDDIFMLNGKPSAQNYFMTTAFAVSF